MRMSPKVLITATALSLAVACTAQAATAKLHTMLVNLPDGTVAHVSYAGDVAPNIVFQPVDAPRETAMETRAMADPFAQMAMISAMMDRQTDAMMQQVAAMQQAAATQGSAPGMTATGAQALPQGMHMTYVSTTQDANGCTRTISYSSDGTQAAPKVTEAASHGCAAATPGQQAAPGKAPAEQAVSPDRRV
jgi:hypothetical protein